jgi:pimeloyl-ACP methyl ester carboxylesterase
VTAIPEPAEAPKTPRRGRLRLLLRVVALTLASLFLVVTLTSFAYNLGTRGRSQPATSLYGGPFVKVDGHRVAYRSWGTTGSPVVLLGGFVVPSTVWGGVGRMLGRDHRVVAIDMPPFGYSERRGPYTLAGWVSLLQKTERALGIERPVVVGHSLGAATAVAAALADPRAVRGIVLLDGDALAGGNGWAARLALDPYVTSAYRLLTGWDWLFRRLLTTGYGRPGVRASAADIAAWQRPFRVEGTQAGLLSLARQGIVGLRLQDLRRVRTPSLVVWGADDSFDSVSAGRASAKALGAPFVLIPRAGHLSMVVAPAAVARSVERIARGS